MTMAQDYALILIAYCVCVLFVVRQILRRNRLVTELLVKRIAERIDAEARQRARERDPGDKP